MELYQSLVTVNPVTLIGQIFNLLLTLAIVKHFFLDKVRRILDRRREEADHELSDAHSAKSEALQLRQTYEQELREARSRAGAIVQQAQHAAALRSEQLLQKAREEASSILAKASADIVREKEEAIRSSKAQIAELSVAIAGKLLERELTADDQTLLIDSFIDRLGVQS